MQPKINQKGYRKSRVKEIYTRRGTWTSDPGMLCSVPCSALGSSEDHWSIHAWSLVPCDDWPRLSHLAPALRTPLHPPPFKLQFQGLSDIWQVIDTQQTPVGKKGGGEGKRGTQRIGILINPWERRHLPISLCEKAEVQKDLIICPKVTGLVSHTHPNPWAGEIHTLSSTIHVSSDFSLFPDASSQNSSVI